MNIYFIVKCDSIESKCLPQRGNFSVGNRKRPTEAISGEYGVCSMTALTVVAFFAKNSLTIAVREREHYRGAKSKKFLFTIWVFCDGYFYEKVS